MSDVANKFGSDNMAWVESNIPDQFFNDCLVSCLKHAIILNRITDWKIMAGDIIRSTENLLRVLIFQNKKNVYDFMVNLKEKIYGCINK